MNNKLDSKVKDDAKVEKSEIETEKLESGDLDDKLGKEDDNVLKRKHEEIAIVHSANEWEKADLGDDDRKNKFLKLMGAAKKEHKGKIVIGEKISHNARSKEETEEVEDALEGQYRTSLDLKLTRRGRHIGLGFQKEEVEVTPVENCEDVTPQPTVVLTPPHPNSNNLKFGHFVKSDSK